MAPKFYLYVFRCYRKVVVEGAARAVDIYLWAYSMLLSDDWECRPTVVRRSDLESGSGLVQNVNGDVLDQRYVCDKILVKILSVFTEICAKMLKFAILQFRRTLQKLLNTDPRKNYFQNLIIQPQPANMLVKSGADRFKTVSCIKHKETNSATRILWRRMPLCVAHSVVNPLCKQSDGWLVISYGSVINAQRFCSMRLSVVDKNWAHCGLSPPLLPRPFHFGAVSLIPPQSPERQFEVFAGAFWTFNNVLL